MSRTLSIRLDDETLEALDDEARRTGASRNRIVRDALAARLRGGDRLGRFSQATALIRGPRDLSTNRTYRRSWTRPRG